MKYVQKFLHLNNPQNVDQLHFQTGLRLFLVGFSCVMALFITAIAIYQPEQWIQALALISFVSLSVILLLVVAWLQGATRFHTIVYFSEPQITVEVYQNLLLFKTDDVFLFKAKLTRLGDKTFWYNTKDDYFPSPELQEMINRKVIREAERKHINHPQLQ